MPDEAFREIQLNGKQLVFLFMTATVVAVVIFLCGVMVGRGVRAPQAVGLEVSSADGDPTADAQPEPPPPVVTPPSSDATPPAALEQLTYPGRLGDGEPPVEQLRELGESDLPAAANSPKTQPTASVTTPASGGTGAAASAEPAGEGFVVQVAAVRERSEADGIAQRLGAKGYPAFVIQSGSGTLGVFRVRVGKYKDRSEAQSVAARLEKEEQFKPWITR